MSRPALAGPLGYLLFLVTLAGCERSSPPVFSEARETADLEEPQRKAIHDELERRCGTPSALKLIGGDRADLMHLKQGAQVYNQYCVQCHGVTGDGQGPAAEFLDPKPRDYRRGIFKFTSTGYGTKPRREDLAQTVTRGVTGTSMPSFARLSKSDLDAVVDYVLALTHRGELETLLVAQAQNEEEMTKESVDELEASILEQWKEARHQVVEPVSKMPDYTPETVAAGQALFQQRECYKCHGRDGRGGLAGGIEVGQDVWGHKAAAADLTSGMLRGGARPIDVYRRIHAGINGTPMPGFKDILAKDPDSFWQLAHYVMHLSDQRRHGVQFPPGGKTNPAAAGPPVSSPAKASATDAAAAVDGSSVPAEAESAVQDQQEPPQ